MFGIETYSNEHLVYLFFGVLPLGGLFLWSYHWKKARSEVFAHIDSFRKISQAVSRPRVIAKRILLLCVYILLVFALIRPQGNPDQELPGGDAGPQDKKITSTLALEDLQQGDKEGKGETVKVRESARDIIFLLDVSASMGAEDLYPDRLSKAKEMIRDIIAALDGEHVGLVVFTSVPSVKCILTLDYTYFKQVLNEVRINDNDFAGTKLSAALDEIISRQFDFSDNKFKELIVITDGGDTDLEGLTGSDRDNFEQRLLSLVKQGQEDKHIRFHTIGLGTRGGAIIPGVRDQQGNQVKSNLNAALLEQISRTGKGIYVAVADSNVDMKEIYLQNIGIGRGEEIEKEITLDPDKLKELVQREKEQEERKVVYQELYAWPLALAIVLLVMEFFIGVKRRRNGLLRKFLPVAEEA